MIRETKIYSDFIKRNKVIVQKDYFIYNDQQITIYKDDNGKWYAGEDDGCYTKKAAIYWHIKNKS